MRRTSQITTLILLAAGLAFLCLQARSVLGGLFFAPFTFGPLFVTMAFTWVFRDRRALSVLLASSILYSAWFAFAYDQLFRVHPDPQSPIGLIFVGIYALPVMAACWIAAGLLNRRAGKTRSATPPA